MKKFLIILLIFFIFPVNIFAEKSIVVSAIVGAINVAPNVKITSPSSLDSVSWVEYVQNWTSIAIDFWIMDKESDDVYYTISVSSWVVSNDNWGPIATTDTFDTSAKMQFHYLAPAWVYWPNVITITANDWVSVSVKELNIYNY